MKGNNKAYCVVLNSILLIAASFYIMVRISYHASHEQFTPSALLQYALLAKECGFSGIHSSDHFRPWNTRQGQSGYSFSWLGAAMQATNLPFWLICAPGYRYHPAVVAQATATLCELFPGRFSLALGSGEAINESVTGLPWPEKSERNEFLLECQSVIRRLLRGETVDQRRPVAVRHAKLYTLPPSMPQILGAALTAETAGWIAPWSDGLLTASQPLPELEQIVNAFRKNGGAGKPMILKVQLSYARRDEIAKAEALSQWSTNIFPSAILAELSGIEQFESLSRLVTEKELAERMLLSSDLDLHIQTLKSYLQLGFDHLVLHNVNLHQEDFIRDFGREVLPELYASDQTPAV